MQTDMQAYGEADRQVEGQTDKKTERQRQTDEKKDRHIDTLETGYGTERGSLQWPQMHSDAFSAVKLGR